MKSSTSLLKAGSTARRLQVEKVLRKMFDDVCQALEVMGGNALDEHVWHRQQDGSWAVGQGEGMMYTDRLLRDGNVFEKIGANYSAMEVQLPPGMIFEGADVVPVKDAKNSEAKENSSEFYAVSTSFVIHPRNPMAPTAHVNYRYFEVDENNWWFGGGGDLTPSYLFEEDAVHFHDAHKTTCDQYDVAFYPHFKKWCDEYFFLPHRGESRGVGGIFFDYVREPDWDTLFNFVKDCSEAFIPAYLPIVRKRKDMPFTEANKYWQRITRGRYAEFIMAIDRGTRFGMQTGLVRPQSVLNPMPATAHWIYDDEPLQGTPEALLREVLRVPRDWV
jgi:coproporphyrinogen III oxidase